MLIISSTYISSASFIANSRSSVNYPLQNVVFNWSPVLQKMTRKRKTSSKSAGPRPQIARKKEPEVVYVTRAKDEKISLDTLPRPAWDIVCGYLAGRHNYETLLNLRKVNIEWSLVHKLKRANEKQKLKINSLWNNSVYRWTKPAKTLLMNISR